MSQLSIGDKVRKGISQFTRISLGTIRDELVFEEASPLIGFICQQVHLRYLGQTNRLSVAQMIERFEALKDAASIRRAVVTAVAQVHNVHPSHVTDQTMVASTKAERNEVASLLCRDLGDDADLTFDDGTITVAQLVNNLEASWDCGSC